ncbi:hypothetical protein DOS48_05350 [Halorubrum sp. PV6]|nr:hypothetical protein DOS48_05350 [Halorubrum sp. PV6]
MWYAVTSRWPFGRNVYESDWDLLVILDACRVDTLREVDDEYDFIENADSVWSVGSQSAEWMVNTLTDSHRGKIEGTMYISGNGFSGGILKRGGRPPANNTIPLDISSWSTVNEDALHSQIEVWETNHDETYGSVLSGPMTDYTIEEGRNGDANRIITHYTQPHLPYIGAAYREGRGATGLKNPGYELLEEGRGSRDEVYEAYKETLRWVLDDVEELRENIDAEKVVITSDHGEPFGEWKAYGHPEGFRHPEVRKVPWVEASAKDEHTREPDIEIESSVKTDVEEHLRDLGYR